MNNEISKLTTTKSLTNYLKKIPWGSRTHVRKLWTRVQKHPALDKPYNWSLRDFELGDLLGRGGFGSVYAAEERVTKWMFAIKVMKKRHLADEEMGCQVKREIRIQSQLDHPNILRLFTSFEDRTSIYMVLEVASQGGLLECIEKLPDNRLDEPRSAKYTYQTADALMYCHSRNIVHRDVKTGNLMLTAKDEIKLGDFGLSILKLPEKKLHTILGTLEYYAPELVRHRPYNRAVDIWSLGITCYEMMVGETPFECSDENSIREQILNERVSFPPHVTAGAKDLIKKLLRKIPSARLPLSDVKIHPWVIEKKAERETQLCEESAHKNKRRSVP